MSPAEMAHRARGHVLITLWRRRHGALGAPVPRRHTVRLDLPATAAAVASSAARRALLRTADNLLDGEWTLFDTRVAGFGSAIDWFRDPKTGRRADARSYCFDVPHRDE